LENISNTFRNICIILGNMIDIVENAVISLEYMNDIFGNISDTFKNKNIFYDIQDILLKM